MQPAKNLFVALAVASLVAPLTVARVGVGPGSGNEVTALSPSARAVGDCGTRIGSGSSSMIVPSPVGEPVAPLALAKRLNVSLNSSGRSPQTGTVTVLDVVPCAIVVELAVLR